MDARQFLADFGHIANAPNGVNRLRDLVRQLAISGRLVKQSAEDSDVGRSLLELRKRRHKLLEERGLIATRKHKNLDRPEGWLSVPKSWRWESLGYLSLWPLKDGDWIESKDQDDRGDVRIVQLADVGVGNYRDRSNRFMTSRKALDLGCYFLERGDILIARLPDPLGRACIFPGDTKPSVTVVDVAVCRCDPEVVNPRFLMNCLNSPAVSRRIKAWAVGTTRQRVATGRLGAMPLPVAPIEEQARIVAKVDELMALCDELEKQQEDRRKLQGAVRQSTLQSLGSAASPHQLQASWHRLQVNFGQLFHAPQDVGQLRNLILDLAVHGLLVGQSDDDEPISRWVSDVKASRTALEKLKLIAKQTPLTDPTEDEYPFPLPRGWAFVRLGQITNKIGSGSTPRGGREVYVKEGVPFLRSQNVWNDGLRLDDVACITPEDHKRMSGTEVVGNDLLLNITGASLGRCALVPPVFGEANVSQHVTIIRPTDPLICNYLHLCILSPYTQSMIWGRQVGMAREGLSKKVLEQFEIPLPPIAEQQRIVARVAELTHLCDVLEQELARSLELAERLAATSVANITGIADEKAQESVKAPHTELIAPLRLAATPPNVKAQAPLASILVRHQGEMSAGDLLQRFGGDIDAFYAQLKTEVAHGWIAEPEMAQVRERPAAAAARI